MVLSLMCGLRSRRRLTARTDQERFGDVVIRLPDRFISAFQSQSKSKTLSKTFKFAVRVFIIVPWCPDLRRGGLRWSGPSAAPTASPLCAVKTIGV
eukprot:COSAG06_NODE_838_length_12005_cov_473.630354_8_plen_96_part_00